MSLESDCETGLEEAAAGTRRKAMGWRVRKRRMNQALAGLTEWRTGERRMEGECLRKTEERRGEYAGTSL